MSTFIYRRGFVKQGMALGGALLLRPGGSAEARALGNGEPANPTLATLHDLHTTHGNFTEKDVPEEQVEEILQASVRAANSSNMQTYSVVVVADRDRMKQICGYQGSRLLVYCVDYNRLEAGAASLGHAYFPDNMTAFVTGSINTAIAAQTAVVAARSLGIDSLLTNGIHRGDMARLWRLLDLPEQHCFPLIALVLGYASELPQHRTGRLTDLGVVHRERYHRLTNAEVAQITARYDDPETHLGLNPDWASQGHRHYLDWLFTSWLETRSQPTKADTEICRFLKRSGFVEPHTDGGGTR
jgi:nitroreductase